MLSTTSAGRASKWIKEGKGAIKWTRLSCRTFAANAVRLQLHALAYNLGNFLRTLATPEPIKDWSLTSLKEKLIKIGAKVNGRYVAFQMAEVATPRNLFADILRMIAELRSPPVTSTAQSVRSLRVRAKLTGEVRLNDGKFGNVQRSAWRRLVPSPSTARANGAGLPNRGNGANWRTTRQPSGESRFNWILNERPLGRRTRRRRVIKVEAAVT